MKNISTKTWIIIFAAIFVICCAAFLCITNFGKAGTVAKIYVDGEIYEEINLDAVTKPYDIKIETKYGKNTVHVEHGAISVTEADCDDLICIEQGSIDKEGSPIICMPHRLVIEIEGDEIDA